MGKARKVFLEGRKVRGIGSTLGDFIRNARSL